MPDKRRWFIGMLSLVLILSWSSPIRAQDKSLYAQFYNVDIRVTADGDMHVVEHQRIVFTQGSFHKGYAVIPTDRTQDIVNVQMLGDGVAYKRVSFGERPGTYTVRNEANQIAIYWYFEYTSNSTHDYELRYTVKGGLRYYPEYGEMWWKAIPPEHAYPIRKAVIRVQLPPGAAILTNPDNGQNYAGTAPDMAQVGLTADRLQATFSIDHTIAPDQEVEVRVRYPPGVISGQAAAWQATFDQQQAWNEGWRPTLNLFLGLLGALISLCGLLMVVGLWYTR